MRARALAFGLALAGHAAAEPQPYRIEYSAPEGCSSREAFVRELMARTPLVRVAEQGDPAATYVVTLSADAEGLSGELVLRELDGRETLRSLRGATCEEVVPALAFIAAILVDPSALSRPREAASPSPPAKAPPAAAPPAKPPRRPPRTPPPPAPASPRPESERAPSPRRGTGYRFGGGAGASLQTAVSPDTAFGPFAELLLERSHDDARGLSFGVAFHRVNAPSVRTQAGRADFTWTAGSAWFCPLSLPGRGLFSFTPCGELQGGTLMAEGSDTIDEKTVVRPWLAFGPLARLELRPLRFLAITLDGMAVFTALSHPSFHFSPEIEVFSVPVVGFASRAGIRAILP